MWSASRASQLLHKRLHSASVGLSLIKDKGQAEARVLSLRPGGAALKSGQIEIGDLICMVDGAAIVEHDSEGVYKLLAGKRGSRVTLTIDVRRRAKATSGAARTDTGENEPRSRPDGAAGAEDPAFPDEDGGDGGGRRAGGPGGRGRRGGGEALLTVPLLIWELLCTFTHVHACVHV